ncbi:MAG: CopG family transcriptional regulator [Alphaproteobacteria bacterium]|nr:CopG family transcriptional regulator [Alphaproteobacteria bacterium]
MPALTTPLRYLASITFERGAGYSVTFPDFPGCFSAADTVDDAVVSARDALSVGIADMLEHGEPLPEATRLERVERRTGVTYALIEVPAPRPRYAKVNISLPEPTLAAIDEAAAASGPPVPISWSRQRPGSWRASG